MTRLRNLFIPIFLMVCLLALWAPEVHAAPRSAGTDHTGTLSANETWTPAGNPHRIDGTLTVPAGITLTLQPGVVVQSFEDYYFGGMVVKGVLNASGAADNKIIFTSKDDTAASQWSGIRVLGGTATLAHVEVRFGGGGGYGLPCTNENSTVCVESGGALTVDDGYFHNNSPYYDHGSGVVTAYSTQDSDTLAVTIQNSRFEANGTASYAAKYYPMILDGPGIHLTLAGNTFANNQVNQILLQNNPMKTQAALTLPAQTGLEAYLLNSDWTIPSSQTLTLGSGLTLKTAPGPWSRGLGMIVLGNLQAAGSQDQPITLDAVDPAFGWSGLVVRGAAGLAQLSHVQILHGGTAGLANTYQANLAVESGARLEMSDGRVANLVTNAANYACGAIIVSNGTAVLNGNTIADNLPSGATSGLYAMRVSGAQSRLEMANNTFSGNYINAVLLGSDGLGATINTLRPQTGLLGYDIGVPYAEYAYLQQPTGELTLEPGTHVRGVTGPWGKGIYFEVQGQLHAMGTADAPVIFEAASSSTPASWGGIYVNGGMAELYQTQILNGGRGQGYPDAGPFPSLWVAAGGKLTLDHGLVSANHTTGQVDVGVLVDNASASLFSSTFTGLGDSAEADYPLKISGADSRLDLRNNIFSSNATQRALLASGAMTGASFTLVPQDGLSGYELVNPLTVPAGAALTVAPGVSIYGRSGAGLVIKGRLVAEQNAGQPILFTAANSTTGGWPGVIFDGAAASGSLEGITLLNGGGTLTGGSSYPAGGLVFYNTATDAVQVRQCSITNTATAGWQIYNSNASQAATLDGIRIASGSGVGIRLSGTSQVLMANAAILDNANGGVNLDQSGVQLNLVHATLARNKVFGVRAAGGATATVTNAILARNALALRAESGGSITLKTALWDANTADTAGSGTINSISRFNGAAAFDPIDGYHLTQYSEAAGKGQAVSLADDLDGSSRPQPSGSSPDLGADEFNQAAALTLSAEKLALPPVWLNQPDAFSNPSGTLLQQYWIRFHYGVAGGDNTALNVSVQDTLPGALTYQAEEHTPQMTFNQSGQQLTWQTAQPLAPQGTVDIQIDTQAASPQPGRVLTNQAVVTAGSTPLNISASTTVPVFSPLITWPQNGEICPLTGHTFSVEGSAQPGTTIEIYEGANLKGSSTTDSKGLFKVNYSASQAGLADLNLRARACASGGLCSGFSQVSLAQPLSFWDPQRSWWEGDPIVGPMAGKHVSFKFRDQAGVASSLNWIIPGVYGFGDTTLHLYACEDPSTAKMPTQIWISADAHVYIPVKVEGNMYTYKIGAAHRVSMQATYHDDPPPVPPDPNDPPWEPDPGDPPDPDPIDDRPVLIDPDGYVFNANLGFDPQNPSQHAVAGSRVTCMAYLPGWGGWVPWPAHLYENQVNPQVVGSSGYFAFFTPPGQYYLQVDGPDGYPSWRSPVVTVVNEIVHVNAPLTPLPTNGGSLTVLQISRAGFSQADVSIPVGGKVRWDVVQGPQEDSISLLADVVDPLLHLISSLDPMTITDGWDSGRLYPGQSYTRQFNVAGVYTYTDSAGHTATIRVTDSPRKYLFLPTVRR